MKFGLQTFVLVTFLWTLSSLADSKKLDECFRRSGNSDLIRIRPYDKKWNLPQEVDCLNVCLNDIDCKSAIYDSVNQICEIYNKRSGDFPATTITAFKRVYFEKSPDCFAAQQLQVQSRRRQISSLKVSVLQRKPVSRVFPSVQNRPSLRKLILLTKFKNNRNRHRSSSSEEEGEFESEIFNGNQENTENTPKNRRRKPVAQGVVPLFADEPSRQPVKPTSGSHLRQSRNRKTIRRSRVLLSRKLLKPIGRRSKGGARNQIGQSRQRKQQSKSVPVPFEENLKPPTARRVKNSNKATPNLKRTIPNKKIEGEQEEEEEEADLESVTTLEPPKRVLIEDEEMDTETPPEIEPNNFPPDYTECKRGHSPVFLSFMDASPVDHSADLFLASLNETECISICKNNFAPSIPTPQLRPLDCAMSVFVKDEEVDLFGCGIFKGRPDNFELDTGFNSYVKTCALTRALDESCPLREFPAFNDQYVPSGTRRVVTGLRVIDSCLELCIREKSFKCKSATYDARKGSCELKDVEPTSESGEAVEILAAPNNHTFYFINPCSAFIDSENSRPHSAAAPGPSEDSYPSEDYAVDDGDYEATAEDELYKELEQSLTSQIERGAPLGGAKDVEGGPEVDLEDFEDNRPLTEEEKKLLMEEYPEDYYLGEEDYPDDVNRDIPSSNNLLSLENEQEENNFPVEPVAAGDYDYFESIRSQLRRRKHRVSKAFTARQVKSDSAVGGSTDSTSTAQKDLADSKDSLLLLTSPAAAAASSSSSSSSSSNSRSSRKEFRTIPIQRNRRLPVIQPVRTELVAGNSAVVKLQQPIQPDSPSTSAPAGSVTVSPEDVPINPQQPSAATNHNNNINDSNQQTLSLKGWSGWSTCVPYGDDFYNIRVRFCSDGSTTNCSGKKLDAKPCLKKR